ncbi:uncharacterized protein MYCFIDRAFT_199933 [Pseudocercospora fijiensis CIRAD86]|uniref:SUN domain-containing protein n=1 Tax=Pseudocercospora fijiensis (strain CIRAD86) TaxID=383855 RepID=M3A2X0_PSEFD|nr:uncharacterized protein MYCFIDRAFT_199933 [Pseudocercospora fijiensis CIRAD86]EME78826.1 hypothetical protein MYCFIDRAFT_199933 [Pseudocercospora fijiensis CIRAD86]
MSGRNQTPATTRQTRSRAQTPLPALPTRQSHAYGAQGKAAIASQVNTTQSGFQNAFANNTRKRGTTREPTRDPSPEGAAPSNNNRFRKKTKAPELVPRAETYVDDEPEVEDEPALEQERAPKTNGFAWNGPGRQAILESTPDDARPATSLQNSALYTASHGPPPPPPPPPRQPTDPFGRNPERQEAHARPERFQPNSFMVFIHTLPRYLRRLVSDANGLKGILSIVLLTIAALIAMARLPLPNSLAQLRHHALVETAWIIGLPGYSSPKELQLRWEMFLNDDAFWDLLPPNQTIPSLQYGINAHFKSRLDKADNATEAMRQTIAVQQAAIAELQRILPRTIVTEEVDGEWQIPAHFWKALSDKMTRPSDSSEIWDHFIQSNEEKLQAVFLGVLDQEMDNVASRHQLVSKDAFQAAMVANNRLMEEEMAETLHKFRTEILTEARDVAKDTLEKSEIMAMARANIAALGNANVVYNTDKALRQVNYLSVGSGAAIDPRTTSKTQHPSNTWYYWLGTKFGIWTQVPNPPSSAIQAWDETTQCWCSANSTEHRAQLGVRLSRKIWPTELTIEHAPAMATRNIAAAPKDFEVWFELDPAEADRIYEEIGGKTSRFAGDRPCSSTPPDDLRPWACLMTDWYDIDSHNFVQSFKFFPDMQSHGISTNRVVFRVTDNWGADHTCMYRWRLAGEEVPQ